MPVLCKKCGYERQPTDQAPDYECPKCGAVYSKVEAHIERQAEEKLRQEELEEARERDKAHNHAVIKEKIIKENQEKMTRESRPIETKKERVVTKTYTGKQDEATTAFQTDAAKMAEDGYYPTSQTWAPGSYGCGAFLLAVLLCFVLIGILVFIYMLIVKPAGTLSVTYELRESTKADATYDQSEIKVCPRCAETIKAAAVVCRYCSHEF